MQKEIQKEERMKTERQTDTKKEGKQEECYIE